TTNVRPARRSATAEASAVQSDSSGGSSSTVTNHPILSASTTAQWWLPKPTGRYSNDAVSTPQPLRNPPATAAPVRSRGRFNTDAPDPRPGRLRGAHGVEREALDRALVDVVQDSVDRGDHPVRVRGEPALHGIELGRIPVAVHAGEHRVHVGL